MKPEKFTTCRQPRPSSPQTTPGLAKQLSVSITEDQAGTGPQITTKSLQNHHFFTRGALKFNHSQVKPGPTAQGGSQLLCQGCLLWAVAGFLQKCGLQPPESLPSPRCSGLAAGLGIPGSSLHTQRAAAHPYRTLSSSEQAQKRLWGALCWEESSRHQFVTDADAASLLQKEPLALLGLI